MPLFLGVLGDTQRSVARTTVLNTVVRRAYVAIGASGAATVTQVADAAGGTITCVKNTTGIYDVTFPIQAAVATSVPILKVGVMLSAAATVAGSYIKAYSPTAGTAQIVTYLNTAGTPVEPANGDLLFIELTSADPNG